MTIPVFGGTRAAMASGALFRDDTGRVLLVRPTYKPGWEIPGGMVEPGESPRAACVREVQEELGLRPPIGDLLVVDWAPQAPQGDKLLFVFDGGSLSAADHQAIHLQADELSEYRYVPLAELGAYAMDRLAARLVQADLARHDGHPRYLEHGTPPR